MVNSRLPSEGRRLPSGKGARQKKCWTCKWWEGPQGRSWTSDGKHCLNPNGPYYRWFQLGSESCNAWETCKK